MSFEITSKQYLSEDFKRQLERHGDVDDKQLEDVVFNKRLSVIKDAVLALLASVCRLLKDGLHQPRKPE